MKTEDTEALGRQRAKTSKPDTVDQHCSTETIPCVSTLTRDIDIANLSVCLAICPSVRHVPVLDKNGLIYCHSFFTTRQPNHSSFISIKHLHKIPTGWKTKYRWGIKISRFSTNKSLYLANDKTQRHSYYGTLIETRMRSIKWGHFQ